MRPSSRCPAPDGAPCIIQVPLGDRAVQVAVWRVRLGRVSAVPARHRSGGERAVGSRAVGAPLRRRPRDARAAGDHPGHRRRRRAARAGTVTRGVPPQRGPRRLRRPSAHPRVPRRRARLRRGARRGAPHDRLHHAHAGAGRTRRVRLSHGRAAPGWLLGPAGRTPGALPGAGRVRQRQRAAVQHDGAGPAVGRRRQRRQPAARRGDALDVGADVAGDRARRRRR